MIRAALLVATVAGGGGDYPPPAHPGAADERPPGPRETLRVCAARPRCLPTIRAAVRAADAGDRIVIAPGRYRETVRVAGAAKRFLRLSGDATVDRIVVARTTGVAVSGLVVREGVRVRDARDTALRHLAVRGGIRLLRAEGGTVLRSSAAGPAAALSIERTPGQTRPRRTMLRHVTLHSSPVGLRLAAARWVTATGLVFEGNGTDVSDDGAGGDVCLPACA